MRCFSLDLSTDGISSTLYSKQESKSEACSLDNGATENVTLLPEVTAVSIDPKLEADDSQSTNNLMRNAIQAILFSILFGMCVPSTDSGTDIQLSARLFMYGHPRWALSTLVPVLINTVFTVFACKEIERKYDNKNWIFYIPLVILQIYPQFCVCRLIFRLLRKGITDVTLKEFTCRRDGLDGGIGCVEPYCESVVQVYIQTAIFACVHNIDPILTRLCYTENHKSCEEYDVCGTLPQCEEGGDLKWRDCTDIDNGPYVGGYVKYEQITNCHKMQDNCTRAFDECIVGFKQCIEICKSNLTNEILELDQDELYQAVNNPSMLIQHPLILDFNAKERDMQAIQMYLLVIGNYGLFLSTYIVSIIASVFGVTKFFRLGHARLTKKMASKGFISIVFLSATFMVLKGMVLAGIIVGGQTTLAYSMLWWLLFTMLPTTFVVLISSFGIPCYEIYQKSGNVPWKELVKMIAKQPSIVLAPYITPYTFTMKKVHILDKLPAIKDSGKMIKKLDGYGSYVYSAKFTMANAFFTMIGSVALLCWKSQVITNASMMITIIVIAVMVFLLGFFVHKATVKYISKKQVCPEHQMLDCYDCIDMYGFYVPNYKEIEACEYHEDKNPFEFTKPIKGCDKCEIIDKRFVLAIFIYSLPCNSLLHAFHFFLQRI